MENLLKEDFHLPLPNWADIFTYYDNVQFKNIHKGCDTTDTQNLLEEYSKDISRKELVKMNKGLTTDQFIDLFESKFTNVIFYRIEITVYRDGSSYIRGRIPDNSNKKSLYVNGDLIIPIFVVIIISGSQNYDEHMAGYEKFISIEHSLRKREREKMYLKLTKYLAGHTCIVWYNTRNNEYDLFETSGAITVKYRISKAMEYFFKAYESSDSESFSLGNTETCLQTDLSREILGVSIICVIYILWLILLLD